MTYSSKPVSQLKYTFSSGGFNSQPGQRSRGALLSADLQAQVQRQMDEQLKGKRKAQIRVIVNEKEELKRTPEEKVSFKKIIEQMKRNKKNIWITEDKSQYFFRIDQSPAEPIFCTYEVKNDSLGEGLFGGVFKAQVLNAETGEAVPDQFIAIKEISDEKFYPNEHKIASYEMRTGKLISSQESKNGFNYIPLDFIDAAPIGDRKDKINKILKEMNEEQLLDLIIDVLLECNEMHKNFIHCDLKGGNILLQKISNAGQVSYKAHIVDWGLARPISSLKSGVRLGFQSGALITPSYAPLEASAGFLDFYTDIHMISAVIANILGYYKYAIGGTLAADIFEKDGLNSLGFDDFIHGCMTDYLNRMRSIDHEDRPNKDEPLKFFRLLKQLKKLNKLQDQNVSEQINILKTKIYLLSKGFSDRYDLCLMSDDTKPVKGKFYIRKKENNSLEYTVIDPMEKPVTGEITSEELKKFNGFKGIPHPFDIDKLKSFLPEILQIASKRGHIIDVFLEKESCVELTENKNVPEKMRKEINSIWTQKPQSNSKQGLRTVPLDLKTEENKLDIPKKLESEYNNIVKKIIKEMEKLPEYKGKNAKQIELNKKWVAPQMEKIYNGAIKLQDKVTLQGFKDFRQKAIVQLINAENSGQYGSFFNKSPDYQICESLKNLLASTLKKERQMNESSRNGLETSF